MPLACICSALPGGILAIGPLIAYPEVIDIHTGWRITGMADIKALRDAVVIIRIDDPMRTMIRILAILKTAYPAISQAITSPLPDEASALWLCVGQDALRQLPNITTVLVTRPEMGTVDTVQVLTGMHDIRAVRHPIEMPGIDHAMHTMNPLGIFYNSLATFIPCPLPYYTLTLLNNSSKNSLCQYVDVIFHKSLSSLI